MEQSNWMERQRQDNLRVFLKEFLLLSEYEKVSKTNRKKSTTLITTKQARSVEEPTLNSGKLK